MHTRRLITFLLGAWLAAIGLVGAFATENFRVADRILDVPTATSKKIFDKMGRDPAQLILRHEINEVNRAMFETSEWIQIGLGVSILVIVIFSRRHSKERVLGTFVITGIMLGLVLAQRFLLTPEMIGSGRLLDFAPAGEVSREREVFGSLHAVYGVFELVKIVVGLIFAGFLFKARMTKTTRSRKSKQVDVIDESDYSHVDG